MNIYYTIEEKYLKAIQKFSFGNSPKAKILLEEILEDEPSYGKAHCLLGCIYYFDLSEYGLAKKHFDLALEFSPQYPDTYYNYMVMLLDLDQKELLVQLAQSALKVHGISKAEVYFYLGQIHEKEKKWELAIQYYRKAFHHSICNEDMYRFQKDMGRIEKKMNSLKKWTYTIS